MEFKGVKINIVIIVIIAVTLLFFAGRHLVKIYSVDRPLNEQLQAISEIEEYKFVERDDKIDLLVSFKPEIDFYSTYNKINELLDQNQASKKGNIFIKNDSSDDLNQAYYQLHYALFEGLATHQYVKMKKNVEEIVKDNQIENHQIWIDNQALYLQLDKGGNSLYRRIPNNNTITLKTEGGGSNG